MSRSRLVLLAAAVVGLCTTGFECASSEMTAAKVDYNNRQYGKAREMLELEVHRNPGNEEAWYYLALTAHEQRDHKRVAEAVDSAALTGKTVYAPKLAALRQNEWVETWNDGIMAFRSGGGEDKDSLRRAAGLFGVAYRLDPSNHEPIRLMGSADLTMGDTDKALDAFQRYIQAVDENVGKGLDEGLSLITTREQLLKELGQPDQEKVLPTTDSAHLLVYAAKGLHVFLAPPAEGSHGSQTVVGWKFGAPSDAQHLQWERIQYVTAEPYRQAGNVWYRRGAAQLHAFEQNPTSDSTGFRAAVALMDKAIPFFTTAQRLDATDEFAATMLSEIYLRTNQLDKAVASYRELLRRFPDNKFTHINYGVLFLKSGNYAGAIEQFKEALRVDSTYALALYYTGIAYKNWSADLQAAARQNGGKETPEQRESYLGKLRIAAQYLERMRAINPRDFAPLGQLQDIYAVLRENTKIKDLLASLLQIENEQRDSAEYWDTMGKLYTVLNDQPKAKEAFARAETLLHR